MLFNEGYCGPLEFNLTEATGTGTLRFRGKLQESDTVNKNNRSYPHGILAENVEKLMDLVKARGLLGELDHPADSIVHFKDASHVITKLWWEGKVLMGEGEVLSTPHGRVLRGLLNDNIRVGMSSRGVGSGKVNENGVLVIGEGFKLITFDAVVDPSTGNAFQEKVVSQTESVKNVSTGIYNTPKKEVVIAALHGVFRQHTQDIKERIS